MKYGTLMHGITEIMYEGTPDYPTSDRYWAIVEKHGAAMKYYSHCFTYVHKVWG